MQSSEINELAAALAKAQGEFTAIPKGETNPFFKSKYAGLPDVVAGASPILSKNGLAISQFIVQNETGEDCLTTYLLHSSGQYIAHAMKLYLGKLDSQSMGSATTYARRYSYMSVLGLVADEDDDANKATVHGGESQNRGQSRQATPVTDDPRIEAILKAAEQTDDSFVHSLATQFVQRGSLTEKQIASGFEKAAKILGNQTRSTPRVENQPEREYQFAEPEERF